MPKNKLPRTPQRDARGRCATTHGLPRKSFRGVMDMVLPVEYVGGQLQRRSRHVPCWAYPRTPLSALRICRKLQIRICNYSYCLASKKRKSFSVLIAMGFGFFSYGPGLIFFYRKSCFDLIYYGESVRNYSIMNTSNAERRSRACSTETLARGRPMLSLFAKLIWAISENSVDRSVDLQNFGKLSSLVLALYEQLD